MNSADFDRSEGPLILFYTPFFGSYPDLNRLRCPVPCRFSIDRGQLAEANAVIFHLPEIRGGCDARKYPGQLWVGWTRESRADTPILANQRLMRHFDIQVSPERSADIWAPYLPDFPTWQRAFATPIQTKIERRPAVMFQPIDGDRSGRNAFAAELMRFLKVDSYGDYLNNRVAPEPEARLATIGQYRFCLAFENTIAEDYVTGTFYDPLLAGTVPVYLGAPNVAQYAPGDRCYVDALRFGGPRGLAAYLNDLDNDPTAYAAYFEWRSKPFRPAFMADLASVEKDRLSRLVELVTSRLQAASDRATPAKRAATPFGWTSFARARLRAVGGRDS